MVPLLPPCPERRHRYTGRRRTSDRVALAGILYVLRAGVAWRDVPRQLVGCSGVTAWRRLRDWTEAGLRPRLHAALLAELRAAGLLEMDDCAIDGSHVRALRPGRGAAAHAVCRLRSGRRPVGEKLLAGVTCSRACRTSLTRIRNDGRGSGRPCGARGTRITAGRADSQYCGPPCRQKAYRRCTSARRTAPANDPVAELIQALHKALYRAGDRLPGRTTKDGSGPPRRHGPRPGQNPGQGRRTPVTRRPALTRLRVLADGYGLPRRNALSCPVPTNRTPHLPGLRWGLDAVAWTLSGSCPIRVPGVSYIEEETIGESRLLALSGSPVPVEGVAWISGPSSVVSRHFSSR